MKLPVEHQSSSAITILVLSVVLDRLHDPFQVVVDLREAHGEEGAGLPAEGDHPVLLVAAVAHVAHVRPVHGGGGGGGGKGKGVKNLH